MILSFKPEFADWQDEGIWYVWTSVHRAIVDDAIRGVSTRTIRRTITDIRGYNSYWAVKKPYISERNRQKRLLWCQDKINWTAEQWRKVLWTDESPFCLRYSGRLRFWRLHNERNSPQCLQGTVKHNKKIMVWGAFAAHGVGHLHRIEGTVDRHVYRQILFHHMKPSL